MRRIIKGIVNRTWKPYVEWYLRIPRNFNYKNISVQITPGVFHPGFFFSTKLMISFLEKIKLSGKNVLEMGCGSGLASIYMSERGAKVSACDISPIAVKCAKENVERTKKNISIYHSDLFIEIPFQKFDLIVVNPPYYKKTPSSIEEMAWYCGEHLDFFQNFFNGAKTYMHSESSILMVLSDECDVEGIAEVAQANQLTFILVHEKKTAWETGFIFNIRPAKLEMN